MKLIQRYKSGHSIKLTKSGYVVFKGRFAESFGFWSLEEARKFVKYLKM